MKRDALVHKFLSRQYAERIEIGGFGDDLILGGVGRDLLAGGPGNDLVFGGAGGDKFFLVPAFNVGAEDVYVGGMGYDTLTLVIDSTFWFESAFQQDLNAWEVWRDDPGQGGEPFVFTSIGLTVFSIEKITVLVDGTPVTIRNDQVTLTDDAFVVNHDAGSLRGNLLENDLVPDLVADVALAQPPAHGTVTVKPDGTFTYVPDPAAAAALAPGETLVDTFEYTVTDADGDTDTAVVTVTIVGPPAGFEVRHLEAGDSFGVAVSSAGDINGDGIDDFAIGGFGYQPSTDKDGTVYVIFGSVPEEDPPFNGTINLATLNGTNGFVIEAAAPEDLLGRSIASVGDVNGDGIDDMLIGAPDADPGGQPGAGEAYLIFGTTEGFDASFDLDSLDGTNGYVLQGVVYEEHAAYAVSSAGDINGDGVNDLLIGAYGEEFTDSSATYGVYVIFGGEDSLAALDARDGVVDGVIDLAVLTAVDAFLF